MIAPSKTNSAIRRISEIVDANDDQPMSKRLKQGFFCKGYYRGKPCTCDGFVKHEEFSSEKVSRCECAHESDLHQPFQPCSLTFCSCQHFTPDADGAGYCITAKCLHPKSKHLNTEAPNTEETRNLFLDEEAGDVSL